MHSKNKYIKPVPSIEELEKRRQQIESAFQVKKNMEQKRGSCPTCGHAFLHYYEPKHKLGFISYIDIRCPVCKSVFNVEVHYFHPRVS